MVKIDLITGFLGSGKTTFLKEYASYLMDQGLKIGILENDFGAVNVDRMLLLDLEGENCELSMVAGACDADCHKRRFKTKLIALGMSGLDRVIVEPSGIYDTEEFFDTLSEEPLNRWYEIGSVIAVVDAKLESSLSKEAGYFLTSQLASAGQIVLSKSQFASPEDIKKTIAKIHQILLENGCKRIFSEDSGEIIQKPWDLLTKDDFQRIALSGYVPEAYVSLGVAKEDIFTPLYFIHPQLKKDSLCEAAEQIFQDSRCGHVFRIKGFLKDEDHSWVEINATSSQITTQTVNAGQEILIVIGESLQEDVIRSYLPGADTMI